MATASKNIFIIYTLISACVPSANFYLLWPQFTVLQITASFSVPVEIPKRKVYFDWGFQMNYDLPYNLSSFYNVPIWPTRHKRSLDISDQDPYRKYSPDLVTHPNDLTAGELYSAIEDLMVSYGYHETCLLKSVCEISRHPFDITRKSLLTEIFTFVLSPSVHQAFARDEILYREAYEDAESLGNLGKDCNVLFPDCKKDPLLLITKIVFHD